ncbi:16S rRNA (cytosine(967)-C(5))-methyltransferase RsmB [Alkalibacillus sp. S2W]|uniref:16S rRNA (cytosine(967)-C(5))-methyltransferase RsmB n=1 Tax=Alkalibacillus sp. S2W TaxID=3386553 RepID=UPI00398CAA51
MAETKTVREIALNLLERVNQDGSFSHILINQTISKHDLKREDRGLLTEMVYGTLQRQMTLDYYLKHFVGKKKLDPWVRILLRMSLYQTIYLSRIPDHAVINEAVTIAKKRGHKGISGFVNGVLRQVQREGIPSLDSIDDPITKLAVSTSHPTWMVKRWVEQYGFETTRKMCESNIESKRVSVRVQPLRIERDEAISHLEQEGIKTIPSRLSSQGLVITEGNVLESSLFPDQLTIQDETSMLVSEMVDPSSEMSVLDACSAPGGKATHMAEKMAGEGTLYAYDLHESKIKLINDKAETLGLNNIITTPMDSRHLNEQHDHGSFDRILLDAPCTGLGVLRSKPDIKYQKSEENISELADVQRQLLDALMPLLKEDGQFVYSTCTVDQEENEHQIKALLERVPQLEVDPSFFEELPEVCQSLSGLSEFGLQLYPHDFAADGFFITRLRFKSNLK